MYTENLFQWKRPDARLTRERAQEAKSSKRDVNIVSKHTDICVDLKIFSTVFLSQNIDIDR